MGTNVSTNYITCPADANKTLGIKLPFLVMIIKNVRYALVSPPLLRSSRSTSLLRCKCSMIRTLDVGSAHRTISRPPVLSLSSVPCPCVSMRAGIRFSSTCPISRDVLTVPTTLRPYACRSTLTAESEESTSPIAYTPRTSCLLNSSSSSQLPARLSNERPRHPQSKG